VLLDRYPSDVEDADERRRHYDARALRETSVTDVVGENDGGRRDDRTVNAMAARAMRVVARANAKKNSIARMRECEGGRRARARRARTRARSTERARESREDDGRSVKETRTKTNEVREMKRALREACAGTYRGAMASERDVREIESAMGALERAQANDGLDFNQLHGKWRLMYTNAADVLGLLIASQRVGVPEVGDIFQSFGCANGVNTGITNEIRLSVPFLLSSAKPGEPGGVGLRVQASYEDVGRRRLALTFQEAQVSEVSISPLTEALLAPALLPRGSLNHQVLLFIKELELKFPLRGALTSIGGGSQGAAVGTYHLTYCDEEVLVGRAGAGGVYIFTRA